jgi:ligand-binding SRPBCC domain-containing protein
VPILELRTAIAAPRERVFDLARSIDLHQASMAAHGEQAIAGVTHGLIELGESVTWRARQFGLRVQLSSRITAFDRPSHFRDDMATGPFKRFSHDHIFETAGSGTLMRDLFDYEAPLGSLGRLADRLFLTSHMTRLLESRNAFLKAVAESTDWPKYVGSPASPTTQQ